MSTATSGDPTADVIRAYNRAKGLESKVRAESKKERGFRDAISAENEKEWQRHRRFGETVKYLGYRPRRDEASRFISEINAWSDCIGAILDLFGPD